MNFIVHKLCEIRTKNLVIIYDYLNAPSLVKNVVIYICVIAHSVYRIDNMVNTAYTSREDKFVTRHFILRAFTKAVKYKSAFHTYFINMSVKVQRNEKRLSK